MKHYWKLIFITVFLFTLSIPHSFGQTTSYYARYSSSTSKYFSAHRQIKTLDNGTLIVGKWSQISNSDSADIMLIKLNEGGGIEWSKIIPLSPQVENFAICEMSDRSIAVAADLQINNNNVSYWMELLVMKLNCQGNVLWSNRLSIDPGTETGSYPMSINEGKNGDLILSSHSQFRGSVSSSASISRIDNAGNMVWSKTFRGPAPATNTSTRYTGYAFYQNDKIFVFGYKNYFSNYINLNKQLYGMRLDYNTGTVEDQRSYNYTEFSTGGVLVSEPRSHFNAEQLSDNSFSLHGIFTHWTYSEFYYYKLIVNPDLSIKLSRGYVAPYYIGIKKSKISVFKNGETHISGSNYETETVYWYATDNVNNTIREKKIKFNNSVLYGFGNFPYQTGPNRSAYCASHISNTPPNYTYYIDQMQVENGDNSVLPCLGTDTPFVKQQAFSATAGTWNWVSITDNEVSVSPFPLSAAAIPVTATFLCGSGTSTGPFQITGTDTICNAANTYTYQVKTNNTLTGAIQWQMDPSFYNSFQQVDDSTISIVFKNTNSSYIARLYATRIGSACTTNKDSLDISVYPSNPVLPATVTVCSTPVDIHCGKWYKTYRWQDGSTDSVYTISQAGTYTVVLTTFCNEVINHTITAFSDNTGLERQKKLCIGDTLKLKVPEGLVNYNWSPDYNVDHIADWEINVYPQQDTSYFFSAETIDGCQVKDTVAVSVNNLPVVSIGPDSTICVRDNLKLQANNSFAGYLWNNGAQSPTITVAEPGTYTLAVADANGCTASDTVIINSKICFTEFSIPNAFTPNRDGKNDIFKPQIKGRLEHFELFIYNRWGQVVFRTNSAAIGWDGAINGTVNAGTYVWMCRYKFVNEPIKTARGTITVIK